MLWACTGAQVHRCTSARVYGHTGTRARRIVSSSHFPTRPLASPAAAKSRARRGGQVRGRQACFGLAQVHGRTGARAHGRTGVQVYGCTGAPDSFKFPFPTRPLASPAVAKYRAGRAAEGEQAYLGFAQRSSDAGSSFIHLSHLLVYSVYPFIRYPFTRF